MCNTIKMMPYNGCSQMLHISLKTEKSFIGHPLCLQSVVGLECIRWGWPASTARPVVITAMLVFNFYTPDESRSCYGMAVNIFH